MKGKITLLFLLFALFSGNIFAQAYIQIGNGTVSTGYPVNSAWNYGWFSAIYPQTDLGEAKQITKIAFDCNNGPKTELNQKIYLKHTSDAIFSNANYESPETNGYTLVYDGSITYSGFTEITLSTPFEYNGTDNLVVHYENRDGSYDYANFNSTTNSINNNKSSGSDESFPTSSGYLNPYPNSLPNVRFFYTTDGPNPSTSPFPVENSSRVALETDLQFSLDETSVSYDVYFGTDEVPTNMIVDAATSVNGINTVDFELINDGNLLTSLTDYFWKVVARDAEGNTTSSAVYKFTTQKMYSTFPYEQDFTPSICESPDYIPSNLDAAFCQGYYGDLTKTYWTYITSPINWGTWSVGPEEAPTEYFVYISPFSLTEGESYSLTTPRFDLSGDFDISFYWMNGNDEPAPANKTVGYDKTYFEISTDNGSTWETLEILEPETAQTEFQYVSLNLTDQGNAVKFRWRYELTGSYSSAKKVFIDNFSIMQSTNTPIINLAQDSYIFDEICVGGQTTFSLNITNNSPTYELVISSADITGPYSCDVENLTIAPTQTGTVDIVFTPTQATASQPGSVTFNTNNATGNNIITLNGSSSEPLDYYFENFDSYQENDIPADWHVIRDIENEFHFVAVNADYANITAPNVLRIYNSDNETDDLIGIMPGVTEFSTNKLYFYAIAGVENEKLLVGVMSDPFDASSFELVEEINLNYEYGESPYEITFPTDNTKPYIAFKHGLQNTMASIRIDNVEWKNPQGTTVPNPATLVYPANQFVDVDIMNEVVLKWSSGGGAPTGYRISLGTEQANPTQILNDFDLGNLSLYQLNNLEFNTEYFWKITPYNSEGDAQNIETWSFTTMEDPTISTFPWSDGFEEITEHYFDTYIYNYPLGWSLENNQDDFQCWDRISNSATAPNNAHTGNNAMHLAFSFLNPLDDWLFTPPMELVNGQTYEISFWYKVTLYDDGTTTSFEKMDVYIGTDNNSENMTVELFSDDNITNIEYQKFTGYFTATADDVYFVGFHGYSDPLQFLLYVDDFEIKESSASGANDIVSFTFEEQTGDATIDNTEKTVDIEVAIGSILSNLTPTIEVSANATISPASDVAQDFTEPVVYTVTAENGDEAEWTVTVSLSNEINSFDNNFEIYPNPAKDFVTLVLNDYNNCEIIITDITGKTIKNQKLNSAKTDIYINDLTSGVYFIIVKTENNTMMSKIIKE